MKRISRTYYIIGTFLLLLLWPDAALQSRGEERDSTTTRELPRALQRRERARMQQGRQEMKGDTVHHVSHIVVADSAGDVLMADTTRVDSISRMNAQNMKALESRVDTAAMSKELPAPEPMGETVKMKKQFIPNPAKATWLAVIFPGGGQIYNRKYWKLPIVYGGFVGCAYALTWNGQMYSDYSQAYLDIMDDNPSTDSYLDLLPPGYNVDANMDYLKRVIKRKKDTYRRYRDLSIFCFIGVYIVSIIDAYVDAELASFDISKDLTLKMEPTIINNNERNLRQGNSYGLQCSLRF